MDIQKFNSSQIPIFILGVVSLGLLIALIYSDSSDSQFDKKTYCAELRGRIEQEVDASNTRWKGIMLQSLDGFFYSPSLNTCLKAYHNYGIEDGGMSAYIVDYFSPSIASGNQSIIYNDSFGSDPSQGDIDQFWEKYNNRLRQLYK